VKQKLLTITIKVQLSSQQYQLSSGVIAMRRKQLEKGIKECQHELAMLNASSRTERQQHGFNTFNEVWAIRGKGSI
jgi:hypothetical protein